MDKSASPESPQLQNAEHDSRRDLARRDVLKTLAAGLATAPLLAEGALAAAPAPVEMRIGNERDQLFDSDWRFHLGDVAGAENPAFNDSGWRRLDLPHDWSVEPLPAAPAEDGQSAIWGATDVPYQVGPFDVYRSENQRATAWCVGGTGWYRKRFALSQREATSHAEVLFDGVYMNSDVWLNGHHLGFHPYGYTSFSYDLSPFLNRHGENVLAVRVRNTGRNSRWYSGSGIYRHVRLALTGAVRVPIWGVYVTTPEVSSASATVRVAVQVENSGQAAENVTVRVVLHDPAGHIVGRHEAVQSVNAGGSAESAQSVTVSSPSLWSLGTPHLYRAEIELVSGSKVVDRTSTSFGIRKVEVDAERGLRINGESVILRGGCMHHCNGLLGSAAIDRADERRVELMKAAGFNAIRCSHNPPSPGFLDACDRVGMAVIDEAFDCWSKGKNPQDYHLDFKQWWRRDIDSMVRRDRNHPSVIFWSIGNEIPERYQPLGVAEAKEIVAEVKRLDPTRPITAAINPAYGKNGSSAELDPAYQYLDVGGYNYTWQQYESDHQRLPQRVMVGTETFPLLAFENWQQAEEHPYVIGGFVWTGMDYLGESGIGNARLESSAPFPPRGNAAMQNRRMLGLPVEDFMLSFSSPYPWFISWCGGIDITGQHKPQLLYKRVLWEKSAIEMVVQRPIPRGYKQAVSAWGWPDELESWTWPGQEGNSLTVRVFARGDEVRLYLNGRQIASAPISVKTQFKAELPVLYAAGELKAVALKNGHPVAEKVLRTGGRPVALRLTADRSTLRRDRNDLAYVALEVLDRAGHPVPDAAIPVHFELAGYAAELAASGTANPKDVRSFRSPHPTTFHGKALAIVRPTGSAGRVTLVATAEGLRGARVRITVG